MQLYKKIKYKFGLLLLAMISSLSVATSCSEEKAGIPGTSSRAGYVTINLSNGLISSRATEADVDALNENAIRSILLCLYPANNPSGLPAVVERFSGIDAHTFHSVSLRLSKDVVEALYPSGATECHAYAVANLTDDQMNAVTTELSLDEIRKIRVKSDFADMRVKDSFVMDGSTDAVVLTGDHPSTQSATGSIRLQRVASKVTIAASIVDDVNVGEGETAEVWHPNKEGIFVTITNGVMAANVTPAELPDDPSDYYSTSTSAADKNHRQRPLNFSNVSTGYPYLLDSPFYTYPNKWYGNQSENMTYMTLMVPWQKEGEANYRNCYYMVPVTKNVVQIVRNTSYRVNINVNMLGSFNPDEPLELTDLSYTAVDWGRVPIDVTVDDYRYLVVNQNTFTMNNVEDIFIPAYTSHPVTITDVKVKYYRYNLSKAGIETGITVTKQQYDNTTREDDGQTKEEFYSYNFVNPSQDAIGGNVNTGVNFRHPLVVWDLWETVKVNVGRPWSPVYEDRDQEVEMTTDTDFENSSYFYKKSDPVVNAYSRYEIEITFCHTDKISADGKTDPNYTRTVNITQYPAMYISTTQNFRNNGSSATARQGNTYINGNQSSDQPGWLRMAGKYSESSTTNSNPNQYVIHVTQLDASDNYIIGDPRVKQYTDLYGWNFTYNRKEYTFSKGGEAPRTNWKEVKDLDGNERRLMYYYPTDASMDKSRWIAPVLRVASSYGVCSTSNTYDDDKARCAGYQEMYYPAGRWRIPTVAEIEFISNLSGKGIIPYLFDDGTTYMSAQGPVTVGGTNLKPGTGTTASVRCVYDEWYWGDDIIKTGNKDVPGSIPFTWGDRIMTNPNPTN